MARLLREHERLQFVEQQIKTIEQEQRQALRRSDHPSVTMARALMRLKSIHINTAWPLTMELFSWRHFQNGGEIGGLVGLEPVPHQSGGTSREQGMSKCGNARLRSLAVEFACRLAPACRRLKVPRGLSGVSRYERWQWLIHQPDSELSCWYEKRFGNGSRRVRKIGFVALARKLLVALWRHLETGEIPKGAALKAISL